MRSKLKDELANTNFVCTTADVWSSSHRSFLGVTVHWVNLNLVRESAALACRRFISSHTYDKIAAHLVDIHSTFDLCDKIRLTVTDNGSNYAKAFAEYGITVDEGVCDDTVEFADVDFVLANPPVPPPITSNLEEELSDSFTLPLHHRCSSHTLSLVGSTDVEKIVAKNPIYGRIHRAAMAKCSAIWNKVSRSPKACEEYTSVMNSQSLCPCPTRWNSLYDSVCSLLKNNAKLKELCTATGISQSKDVENKFLTEYVDCMQPIADSLDRLQGNKECFMGDLIPTLLRTRQT